MYKGFLTDLLIPGLFYERTGRGANILAPGEAGSNGSDLTNTFLSITIMVWIIADVLRTPNIQEGLYQVTVGCTKWEAAEI